METGTRVLPKIDIAECAHKETRIELTPEGKHYGKQLCVLCGKFVRWAKKPKRPILVIQDTREQAPLDLSAHSELIEVKKGTLSYGDYAIKTPNLLQEFVIERKSLADFVACCGRERERFQRELTALRGYKQAYIVCEFGLRDILDENYRSKINPKSVLSSIARWQLCGVDFMFCDTADGASYVAAKLIEFTAEYWCRLADAKFGSKL